MPVCSQGHENPSGNAFCGDCGAALLVRCSNGHENPVGNPFCGDCGQAMAAVSSANPSVTVSADSRSDPVEVTPPAVADTAAGVMCPKCGKNDMVQKVTAIVTMGTTDSEGGSKTGGISVGGSGMRLYGMKGKQTGTATTQLAARFPKPVETKVTWSDNYMDNSNPWPYAGVLIASVVLAILLHNDSGGGSADPFLPFILVLMVVAWGMILQHHSRNPAPKQKSVSEMRQHARDA